MSLYQLMRWMERILAFDAMTGHVDLFQPSRFVVVSSANAFSDSVIILYCPRSCENEPNPIAPFMER